MIQLTETSPYDIIATNSETIQMPDIDTIPVSRAFLLTNHGKSDLPVKGQGLPETVIRPGESVQIAWWGYEDMENKKGPIWDVYRAEEK